MIGMVTNSAAKQRQTVAPGIRTCEGITKLFGVGRIPLLLRRGMFPTEQFDNSCRALFHQAAQKSGRILVNIDALTAAAVAAGFA